MTSLEFKRLPLVEVALRLSLAEPLPVNLTRVAELHRDLAASYPFVEDVAETEVPPGRALTIELGASATKAARYTGQRNGLVATLQTHMIALRWVRQSRDGGPLYPRFPALLQALGMFTSAVARALERKPVCDVASMTYVNFVETSAQTVGGSLRRYFRDELWPATLAQDATFQELNLAWSEGGTDLRVIFARGEARFEAQRIPGYRLVTVAGKRFDPTESPADEVSELHERLQTLFASIISDQAKQEWDYV